MFKSKVEFVADETIIDKVVEESVNYTFLDEKQELFRIQIEDTGVEKEIVDDYINAYNEYADDFESNIKEEPILSEKSFRYTVYPIQYDEIWKNYKTQQRAHWIVEEVDMSKDRSDWETKLNDNERYFLSHILAFFAASDGIVSTNLMERFMTEVKIREALMAFGKQNDMENVHGESYSLMLDTCVRDRDLVAKLIRAIELMPCIKRKKDWCEKWINSDKTFSHRVIAFGIVEGVFFSGSFASIFWLRTRGPILGGVVKYNKLISRDEGLHVELAYALYALLKNRLKQEVVYEIIKEAVEVEKFFIITSLPCRLLGINSDLMIQYIEYVADRSLIGFGYQKLYNRENPFEFMKQIDVENKENFFEERSSQYAVATIDNPKVFSTSANF